MSQQPDAPDVFSEQFWDERYGSSERVWSGAPNPQLVDRVAPLSPGRVLDVGCGEGADAIWLARQGWQVTALDVSQVALDKAAAHAADNGVADQIEWRRVDLSDWDGEPDAYDLVSAQFMYLGQPAMSVLYGQLAEAVASGGILLLVGHDPSDPRPGAADFPDVRWTAEDMAATLDPDAWRSIDATTVERGAPDGDGGTKTMHDAIVQALR